MKKNKQYRETNTNRGSKSFLHHSREFYRENSWWIMPTCFLASIALGFFGFWQYNVEKNNAAWSTSDLLYGTLQLIMLDSGGFSAGIVGPNPYLDWARFLVPIFGILAILETLVKIATVQIDFLLIRLFFRQHVIICGLDENGKRLAERHRDDKKDVIIIESDKNNENLASVVTYGSSLFRLSIKAIVGNASDKVLLKKLKVHEASIVYAFTDRDDLNLRIALQVREVLNEVSGETKPPLICHIHILEKELYDCLHRKDPFDNNEFNAEVFNIHEQAARIMFRKHSPDQHFPIGPARKEAVNILLVGAGWLGEKLLHQIVRVGHFANRQPTHVTVIDRNALVLDALRQRLGNIDITNYLEIICSNVDVTKLGQADLHRPQYDIAYVCVGDDNQGFVCAHHLRNQSCLPRESMIVVAMPQKNDLADVLSKSRGKSYLAKEPVIPVSAQQNNELAHVYRKQPENDNIIYFKTIDEVIPDLLNPELDDIAKKVHRAWNPELTSDADVDACWKDNPDYRESSRSNADHLDIKLRAIGCILAKSEDVLSKYELKPEEIDLLAEMEHRRYYAERLLLGWAFGPEHDPKKKKGPYIQDFENLTDNQKEKNRKDFVGLISKLEVRMVKPQPDSKLSQSNSYNN